MFEMAAIEGVLTFSPESIVEDVLQEHAEQCPNDYFDVRRVEEEVIRRYEATAWLRQIVGVIGEKDLPAEPCEEEFRRGLRSGIILCKTLNKIQTGAVQKVVENPCDAALLQDGAALSAYQYFENLRNFLSAVQEMGLPTFDASDLEEGGKSARVVNCILALKSYSEWKKAGGQGVWRYGGNMKPIISGKRFVRKTSEPFTSCLLRTIAVNEKTLNHSHTEKDLNGVPSSSLSKLLRAILVDKKSEEVPNLVESVLHKVMEQLEPHVSRQTDPKKTNSVDSNIGNICMPTSSLPRVLNKIEEKNDAVPNTDLRSQKNKCTGGSECRFAKQQMIVSRQHKDLKVLKQTLSSTKAGMQLMQMKFHEEIKKLGVHLHRLAHAASSYHRVLEENRKLYNQVQDLKGSIRVYCRVRPFLTGQCNYFSTVDHIDEGTITINTLLKSGKGQKIFSFNKVFGPSATQDEVFADTQPLVRSVLDGYNVCIFAYGQTGSGKTYTMTGPNDINQRSQGVNYRSLSDLFLLVEQRKDSYFYDISVQMIEIYNEQVRDLLVTDGLSKRLEIRNNSQIGFSVPDANLVHVSSTFDVINLMNLGQSNRAVGTTALNDRSSRSHSCLTVHVQGRDLTSGNVLRGCMHLVDLAGSERVDKSEVTGDSLKEAQHINRSLSALGDVISSLAQKNSHVPYRNSKLTQLLQYSLGGQAKTLMFVHISPEPDAIGETISTLKFAERVASVELGAARVNKDSAHVKELKEQIAVLRAALARKDGEPVSTQHKVSGSRCKMHPSPSKSTSNAKDCGLASPIGLRKPMEEVGNIEIFENSAPMQKKQVLDSNELLRNSPLWSPVRSSCRTKGDYDREVVESAGLVDKLMVKHDHLAVDNHLSCQNQDHNSDANIVDVLAQKYLLDPSTYSLEKQCGPLSNTADEQAELNAGSSDSSEQDFLLQFNHSKLGCYVAGLKAEKRCAVVDNSPKFRSMIPKLVHSSPRKAANGAGQAPRRIGRQSVETKHKAINKK